jgi:hypothetical protein
MRACNDTGDVTAGQQRADGSDDIDDSHGDEFDFI